MGVLFEMCVAEGQRTRAVGMGDGLTQWAARFFSSVFQVHAEPCRP